MATRSYAAIGFLLLLSILYFVFVWNPKPDYGISYNEERKRIGQPIIEEYFVPVREDGHLRQTWITPDSLKATTIHLSKNFNTSGGKIVYEFDLFSKEDDSLRTLLLREYFFDSDSIAYSIKIEASQADYLPITKQKGDSILLNWNE